MATPCSDHLVNRGFDITLWIRGNVYENVDAIIVDSTQPTLVWYCVMQKRPNNNEYRPWFGNVQDMSELGAFANWMVQ